MSYQTMLLDYLYSISVYYQFSRQENILKIVFAIINFDTPYVVIGDNEPEDIIEMDNFNLIEENI